MVELPQGRLWRQLPPMARWSLRVDLDAASAAAGAAGIPLSAEVCRARLLCDWAALWLGPDEQLLVGPESGAVAMAAGLNQAFQRMSPDHAFSLVDVSHRQGAIEVSGMHAADLINTGCPLDLGLLSFPPGSCTRTLLAKADVVIWRREANRFHLEVWRSFLPYVEQFLSLAEQELS